MPQSRRRNSIGWILGALFLISCPALEAHFVSRGVGTAIQVVFKEDKILLTFDLGFGALWGGIEMRVMDTNRDGTIGPEEAEAYKKRTWENTIAPHLQVVLNDASVPVRLLACRAESLEGSVAVIPFDLYYDLEAAIPYAGPEDRKKVLRLEILNRALEKDSTNPPLFYLPYAGHDEKFRLKKFVEPEPLADLQNYVLQGRKLVLDLDFSGGEGLEGPAALRPLEASPVATLAKEGPGSEGDPSRPGEKPKESFAPKTSPEEASTAEESRFFEKALARDDPGLFAILGFILLAFLYGAGHALAPGHGKTMVAAYLVGSRGRIRDAVFMGSVVTFTHTFSVFLVGLLLHWHFQASLTRPSTVKPQTLQNWYIVGYTLLGGAMLLFLGLVLFFRRWRWAGRPELMFEAGRQHGHGLFGHSHGHARSPGHGPRQDHEPDHEHSHSHEHVHEHDHRHEPCLEPAPDPGPAPPAPAAAGQPSLWEMLYLGIAGGIVPCPAGLTVIALGLLYPKHLPLALGLLVVFSCGLGSVLIAVGVLLVTGKNLIFENSPRRRRLLSYLPALSALFIAGLGAFFMVETFLSKRPEIASMLAALADQIRGQ